MRVRACVCCAVLCRVCVSGFLHSTYVLVPLRPLLQTKSVVFEQEMYDQIWYRKDRPYFHIFPGDVSCRLLGCRELIVLWVIPEVPLILYRLCSLKSRQLLLMRRDLCTEIRIGWSSYVLRMWPSSYKGCFDVKDLASLTEDLWCQNTVIFIVWFVWCFDFRGLPSSGR